MNIVLGLIKGVDGRCICNRNYRWFLELKMIFDYIVWYVLDINLSIFFIDDMLFV